MVVTEWECVCFTQTITTGIDYVYRISFFWINRRRKISLIYDFSFQLVILFVHDQLSPLVVSVVRNLLSSLFIKLCSPLWLILMRGKDLARGR